MAGFIFEELQATKYLRLQAAARYEQDGGVGHRPRTCDGADAALVSRDETFRPEVGEPRRCSTTCRYDVVARASAQYVERAPDAAELFSQGPHEATETFEIGNPDLAKERRQALSSSA